MQGVREITPEEALASHRWAVVVRRSDGVEFVEELTFSESVAVELAARLRVIYAPEGGSVEVAHVEQAGWRQTEELPMLVDVDKAAEMLSCSPEKVRKMCRDGALRAVRVGRLWRVNTAALLDYLGMAAR